MTQILTNEYTLSVLLTILPYISNFSEKLGLPVHSPLVTNQVARFTPFPEKEGIGGYVVLTNGLEFWFEHGFVNGYRTPKSYYDLQDPKEIPMFYGSLNLDRDAATQKARNSLLRLGYKLKEIFADQNPQIEMPPQSGTNVISYYSIRWLDPIQRRPGVVIDLSGIDGTINKMRFFSSVFWRDPPRLTNQPNSLPIAEQAADDLQTSSLKGVIIEESTALAEKLRLPLEFSSSADSASRMYFETLGGDTKIELKNGYWLYWRQSYLRGFSAPDSVYSSHRHPEVRGSLRVESYLGSWNMSTNEALFLARTTIREAGLHIQELEVERKPDFISVNDQVGGYVIPRYYFVWESGVLRGKDIFPWRVEIEIDASAKAVKYLYVEDGKRKRDLWNSEQVLSDTGTNSTKQK